MAGGRYLPVVVCVGVLGELRLALGGGQRVPWSTSSQSLPGELSAVGGGNGDGSEGDRC